MVLPSLRAREVRVVENSVRVIRNAVGVPSAGIGDADWAVIAVVVFAHLVNVGGRERDGEAHGPGYKLKASLLHGWRRLGDVVRMDDYVQERPGWLSLLKSFKDN